MTDREWRDARADLTRAELFLSEREANPGGNEGMEQVIEGVIKRAKELRIALADEDAKRRKALAENWHRYPCRWRDPNAAK